MATHIVYLQELLSTIALHSLNRFDRIEHDRSLHLETAYACSACPGNTRPVLTESDIASRLQFAQQYRHKGPSWWIKGIHLFLDNKTFQIPLTQRARAQAASAMVRGVYRKKGESLLPGCVRASKKMTSSFGVRSVVISGGISGNGEVTVWHAHTQVWGGKAASELYAGPVCSALSKLKPGARTWVVCEDNDPSGFRSSRGLLAKQENGISTFRLPPRSPDLQPLDYSIWHQINTKLRAQEKRFRPSYKETRAHFLRRLRGTAKSLDKNYVQNSIKDMARRVRLLFEAGGGLFEEGR